MTGIVREHNLLTGYRFVIAEYGLVGLGVTVLVGYYLIAGRFVEAIAWFGIAVNSGIIALLAVASLRNGARDIGLLPLRERSFRETVGREHPGLGRRTLVLIAVWFAPYLLAALVLIETVAADRSARPAGPGQAAA